MACWAVPETTAGKVVQWRMRGACGREGGIFSYYFLENVRRRLFHTDMSMGSTTQFVPICITVIVIGWGSFFSTLQKRVNARRKGVDGEERGIERDGVSGHDGDGVRARAKLSGRWVSMGGGVTHGGRAEGAACS